MIKLLAIVALLVVVALVLQPLLAAYLRRRGVDFGRDKPEQS